MKLKNKKTGAIYSIEDIDLGSNADGIWLGMTKYNSLAELNKEWEDYEEPKDYYFIRSESLTVGYSPISNTRSCRNRKQIGNYFETKEEAERAVKKLKAWKRLKETGCKPINWRWKQDYPNDACYVEVVLKCQFDSGVHDKELDLLFGGEE